MTASDRELDRKIAKVKADIAKCKPASWTSQQFQKSLDYLLAQRSLPRESRLQYSVGAI